MKKSKKMISLVLAIAMVLLVPVSVVSAAPKGYGFRYAGVTVYVHGKASGLIDKMGEPNKKSKSKSCAYDGEDIKYVYDDFTLVTYTEKKGGTEYVQSIKFTSKKAKTKEGIKIGSKEKTMKKKYGRARDNFGVYTYKKGKMGITFTVDDGKVSAAMLFSLFSEAGMAAPQMVQAATYQKTIKNKSVKKPEVLVGADKVKVFSIKVKEIGKQIQEAETTEPSDDTKNQDGESAQQEEKTTEITEKTETTDITTETTEENGGGDSVENIEEAQPEQPEIVSITYRYKVTVNVKNKAKNDIRKLLLTGKAGGKTITFTAKNLKAGKTMTLSKNFELTSKTERDTPEFECQKLQVYAGSMVSTYRYASDKLSSDYATPDKKAPEIRGFVGKNSYNGSIPYQTIYSDQEKTYDYFKYVYAQDNRDAKITLKVDTSKVNFKKKGTYTITYTAEDKAGNVNKKTAKIAVRVNDSLDQMADTVLGRIIKKDWSDQKKATAIYNYTRGHIAYTGNSNKSSWEKEASNGLRYGRGDCFTYYCVSRALLTRAGIPNIEVTRVQGYGHHWWNMAYVNGGFYHFDTCPRKAGGRFCLLTDAQLKNYSATVGKRSHIWAYSQKPKSPEKVLSSIF